jgi:endonuclease/exonuclease/phosphatase family metal-dependent hydrolase
MRHYLITVFLVLLFGCTSSAKQEAASFEQHIDEEKVPSPAKPKPFGSLRIVSYNIKKGNPVEPIAEELRAQNPDIILLQEIDDKTSRSGDIDQTKELARALSMNSFYSPSYEELGGTTGQAILSRFPLWDGQVVSMPQSRNIAAAATTEFNGVPIRLFSIHLSSTVRAGWTFAKEASSERTREATRIGALVKETSSLVVVGGDFNTEPDSKPYNIISNLLTEVSTREATLPAPFPVFSYDHVMASPSLKSSQAFVGPAGVSDHRMVIVDLVMPSIGKRE